MTVKDGTQRCSSEISKDTDTALAIETESSKRDCTTKNMVVEYFRFALLLSFFVTAAICLHVQQWVGALVHLYDRAWAEQLQAAVKALGAILVVGLNQWRSPITTRISGDPSVRGQIRMTPDGKVIFDFPSRIVLIANHQLYTEWILLWWSAYTAGHHGSLIIVLKDAIKKIPILGRGMVFFSFIFLSRRWEADKAHLEESLDRLSDSSKRTPMWLLIFPEGTNLSKRSLGISRQWAERNGLPHSDLTLLPRTRGLRACLDALAGSVDWLYDCTIAYERIPRGKDGQDIYNLKTLYIKGLTTPVTHTHWRRFAVKDIPTSDPEAFDQWLYERWAEKDKLLEHFQSQRCFPADDGYIKASVQLRYPSEILQVFTGLFMVVTLLLGVALIYRVNPSHGFSAVR